MDKINISNLFPNKQNNDDNYSELNVSNLFNIIEKKPKKTNFDLERLSNLREERKKKILVQYEKIFNLCLNKINIANNLNKLEIVYDVPEAIYGSFEYKSIDCLLYISEKLKKMGIDIIILNEISLYVSWQDIGKKSN